MLRQEALRSPAASSRVAGCLASLPARGAASERLRVFLALTPAASLADHRVLVAHVRRSPGEPVLRALFGAWELPHIHGFERPAKASDLPHREFVGPRTSERPPRLLYFAEGIDSTRCYP